MTDSPASDKWPAVSPDGRNVVFTSTRSGDVDTVWRMDIDGGNPLQLARFTEANQWSPAAFSPDGRWLIVEARESGKPLLWKVPVEGGEPVKVMDQYASYPTVSPDGKWIAHVSADASTNETETKVNIIPFEGGPPTKVLVCNLSNEAFFLRWSTDGQSVLYVDASQGGANVWRLPLDGGPPRQVTDFKDQQIWNFGVSPDGKQIAVARGANVSDVVMISEEK